jgi:hypothetical protein
MQFVEVAAEQFALPLVGGMRERHFIGIHFKPRKLPENAQSLTCRLHALLGVF